MSLGKPRAQNILMTCAVDVGIGGVQVVFRDLVRWVESTGRRVHLLYPGRFYSLLLRRQTTSWGRDAWQCPMPVIAGHSVIHLAAFLLFLPLVLCQLLRLLRKQQIDAINCHYLSPYFVHLVIVGRLRGIPIVISVHGADIDVVAEQPWLTRTLLRMTVRGATRVVACSEALARQTAAVFPSAADRVTWVHNALSYTPSSSEHRSAAAPFVLCVCRHVHKKGVDTLLRAFVSVSDEFPDLRLVLVGDGPLFDQHRALSQTLGIKERVVFKGKIEHGDVSRFFSECELLVLPSRAEPFGLVLLEAAACRKPIVATRVGGVPEIIVDRFNGLLVGPDDPAALAAAIVTLVRDQELKGRLGNCAYQTLISRFLWKDRINDYIDIYEGHTGPPLMDPGRVTVAASS